MQTVSHEDFPSLPKVSAEKSFTLRGGDLVKLLRSVASCASTSAVKPELQSVLLLGEGGVLIAAATDSFRLAEKSVPLRSKGSVPPLLLPARNAVELIRVAESSEGDTEMYYTTNQLSLQAGRTYYTSRLVEGTFPNYKQIVPKQFSTDAVMLREDIAVALKSLAVFADKFFQVSLSVDPRGKMVTLSSRNADVGEETCTLRATTSGEPVVVTFNGRYLADGLQSIGGESVRLSLNGVGKPMLIKDAADDSFFYLAMPMNR